MILDRRMHLKAMILFRFIFVVVFRELTDKMKKIKREQLKNLNGELLKKSLLMEVDRDCVFVYGDV